MSLQPQFSEHFTDNRVSQGASSPYWEEPASSPYWDGSELGQFQGEATSQSSTSRANSASPEILRGLTTEQQHAVQITNGPLIIVGTPGSGKTLVVVRRIAHLVRDLTVPPWSILSVTFTNKAAKEMRVRLDEFLDDQGREVTMGTFHSICARILRRHGERIGVGRNFTIYDQDDQLSVVKSAMQLADVDPKSYNPRALLSRISAAKSSLQDSRQMAQAAYDADDEYGAHWIDVCARVYRYYEEALTRQNSLDFDDLLMRTAQLLETVPEVQAQYHDRYRYLLIDEFQDTNLVQYKLARLLTGPHQNLCVVGDPDQSIYSWRGANLENYEKFIDDFPEVQFFRFNFRSGQKILDAAYSLINAKPTSDQALVPDPKSGPTRQSRVRQHGPQSPETSLWRKISEWLWGREILEPEPNAIQMSAGTIGNDDQTAIQDAFSIDVPSRPRLISHESITNAGFVSVMELGNAEEEASWAISEISRLARSGRYEHGDCAVMYRTNAQSRAFEDTCLHLGIPYRLVGGVRFYHRREIQDILCYLRVIYNPNDEVSLTRIINTPPRGIGAKTVQQLTAFAARQGMTTRAAMTDIAAARAENRPCPINVTARAARSIADLSVTLDRLGDAARELGVADLLDRMLDMSGLARNIHAQDDGEERWENILELRGLAEDYGPPADGSADGLSAFLERVSLVSDVDQYEQSKDALTLITLHQTKGLEFPVVIIAGLEEGLLPHIRSLDTVDETDEERRLCYVGMTRAKERLYMSFVHFRAHRGGIPSRFLKDLPGELLAGTSLGDTIYAQISGGRNYVSQQRNRNPNTVIGGEYATRRRESRTRLGDGAGPGGDATRGRLRGNIDEKLTEWDSSRSVRSKEPQRVPLTVGEIVRHAVFGEGVVQDVQGQGETEQASINFGDDVGLKRLLVSLAPLERG